MKIGPVGAICSMRTDRRTDMTKLIVAFRRFANSPKNDREIGPSFDATAHSTRLGMILAGNRSRRLMLGRKRGSAVLGDCAFNQWDI
jgi:hypothetical protein